MKSICGVLQASSFYFSCSTATLHAVSNSSRFLFQNGIMPFSLDCQIQVSVVFKVHSWPRMSRLVNPLYRIQVPSVVGPILLASRTYLASLIRT